MSDATICINEETSTVSASIDVHAEQESLAVIRRANDEAIRLLCRRSALRRFRKPITVDHFDSDGVLFMRFNSESGFSWGGKEKGEPNAIVCTDCRGRKATVLVKISCGQVPIYMPAGPAAH